MIYLDYAATTFPKPHMVLNKINEINQILAVNAGRGSYQAAKEANALIDETREEIAKLVHILDRTHVIFSSSVSMALNQILRGMQWKEGDTVYVSPYEHNAVLRTLYDIQKKTGIVIIQMPLQKNLEIDLAALSYRFSVQRPSCVCMTHISNVTGYILPIEKIAELAKKRGAVVVVDAAQSLGLLPIDMKKIPIDFLAFTGHKNLYGPFGVGGFVYESDKNLEPVFTGGTGSNSRNLNMPEELPGKYEFASPNIGVIAGFSEALKWIGDNNQKILEKERQLTQKLIEELEEIKGVRVYRMPEGKQIGIVSILIEGYQSEDIGRILDEDYDIAVRCGYHCAAYVHEWLDDIRYGGTVRISIGWWTKAEDIDMVVKAVRDLAEE